jgi:hypothetical protein
MDALVVISDIIDNQNFDTNFHGDLQQMASDYNYQILMEELKEEINS